MNVRSKSFSVQLLCLVALAVIGAQTNAFAVSACLSARFTDYRDFGCRLPPDPWRDLTLGNPQQCPPCSGVPVWWVSEPYVNLWVADEPLSYPMSSGERMTFRWTYRQRARLPEAWRSRERIRYKMIPIQLGEGVFDWGEGCPGITSVRTNAVWSHNWWSGMVLWDTFQETNAVLPNSYAVDSPPQMYFPYSGTYSALALLGDGGVLNYEGQTAGQANGEGKPRLEIVGPASALGGPRIPVPTPEWNPYPTNSEGVIWVESPQYGLRLVYPDGRQDVHGLVFLVGAKPLCDPGNPYDPCAGRMNNTARTYLTQRIDPQGRITRLGYQPQPLAAGQPAYVLRYVLDPDGRTNTYFYNPTNRNQLTRIDDPHGRSTTLGYDPVYGTLTSLVDAVQLTNTFQYQTETVINWNEKPGFPITCYGPPDPAQPPYATIRQVPLSGWLSSYTTPYGTTSFSYYQEQEAGATDEYTARAVRVSEPGNAQQLYYYRHRCDGLVPASATAPTNVPGANFDTGLTGSEHPALHYRNSFHWDRRQFAALSVGSWGNLNGALTNLTANDYRKGRMQHWLLGTNALSVTGLLSSERDPSPDAAGQTEGARTWYDYAGKNPGEPQIEGTEALLSCLARTLPDGTEQYTAFDYTTNGYPSKQWETFTQTNGMVGVRTNVYNYATNGVDFLSFINADTRQLSVAYNTNRQVTFVTNALNEVTSVSYVGFPTEKKPLLITFPSGQTAAFTYYTGYWTNISGTNVYQWLPDARFLKRIQWNPGPTWSFGYDRGLVKNATNDLGLVLSFTWDDLLRLTSVRFSDSSYLSNRYDKLDLAATRDRLGHWTSYGYDALQHLTAITNANNAVSHLSWCDCGALSSITDALTNVTSFYYDNQGNLTNRAFADGSSLKYIYDSMGRLTGLSDGLNRSFSAGYNQQGLLTTISNAYGPLQSIVYDVLDRPFQITDANNVTATHTFDALDRLLTRGWPDGGMERFGYIANLFPVTSYTNQLGSNVVNLAYDAALRLTNAVYPGIATNRFTYDTASRLLTLTDGKNQTTTWLYDLYGHATNKLDAAANEIFRFAYDANSRLTNRWTPAKGTTLFRYDVLGNLTNVDYSGASTPTPSVSLAYDILNRLATMIDGVGTHGFTWTAAGQLQSEDGPWPDDAITFNYAQRQRTNLSLLQPGASAWTQGYGYDSARRLTALTSPAGTFGYGFNVGQSVSPAPLLRTLTLAGGASITNNYDSVGRLLGTVLNNSAGLTLNAHSYAYDLAGERTRQTFKTGNYVDYGYDLLGQLTSAKGKESGGAINRLQEQLSYLYDAAGNLNFRTNNALVQNFNLNNLNELTTATRSGTFTVAGNTTTLASNVTVNGSTANRYADNTFAKDGFTLADGNNTFTVAAENPYGFHLTNSLTVNLPATTTFVYDLNGNLRTNGTRIYDYDAENQLATNWVPSEWKTEFVYDGFGRRRITREYGWTGSAWNKTNETRQVYDGLLPLQERDANNAVKVTYTRGRDLSGTLQAAGGIGGLLARTDTNGSAFYHADGSGNITALINSNQLVVAKYLYDSFGNLLAQSGPLADANRYRFSSKEIHPLSGLYYYGFRFYDPTLQRWLTPDPIGEAGGINLYQFVGNSPLNAVEPYGLTWALFSGEAWGQLFHDWFVGDLPPSQVDPTSYLGQRGVDNDFNGKTGSELVGDIGKAVLKGPAEAAMLLPFGAEEGAYAAANEVLQAARAARALAKCKAAEAKAAEKLKNILTKNFKPGPKGDISGAISDMVGNPILKPGGGNWDHVQDLNNILRGLRNNVEALKNATDPAIVALRQQAEQAIQQIEQAIKGAGL